MSDIRQDRSKRRITGLKDNGAPIYSWRDDNDKVKSTLDDSDLQVNDFKSDQNIQGKMTPQQLSNIIGDYFNGSSDPSTNYNIAMQDIIECVDFRMDIPTISSSNHTVDIVDALGETRRTDEPTVVFAVSEVKDSKGNSTYYKHTGYYNEDTLSYDFIDENNEPNIVEVVPDNDNTVDSIISNDYDGVQLYEVGNEKLQRIVKSNPKETCYFKDHTVTASIDHVKTMTDPGNGKVYEYFNTFTEDKHENHFFKRKLRYNFYLRTPYKDDTHNELDLYETECVEEKPSWKEVK